MTSTSNKAVETLKASLISQGVKYALATFSDMQGCTYVPF